MLLALFAIMFAQGAVWYTAFFYVQIFMERSWACPGATKDLLMIGDRRQRAALCLLRLALRPDRPQAGDAVRHDADAGALFPRLPHVAAAANPALAEASSDAGHRRRRSRRLLAAVRPRGQGQLRLSCDIAKSALANAASPTDATGGRPAVVAVGAAASCRVPSGEGLPTARPKAVKASVGDADQGRLPRPAIRTRPTRRG